MSTFWVLIAASVALLIAASRIAVWFHKWDPLGFLKGSSNRILDDPLVAGVAHVEIIDHTNSRQGDAAGMPEALPPHVVPSGRAAVVQQ